MSKRTVFDHLTEQLDSVVKGRRYIIAEIGKLKESVMDLEESLAKSSGGGGGGMGSLVGDLKNFMQQTIGTLGQLKSSFSNLSNMVQSVSGQVQQLKAGGGVARPATSAAQPAPQQQSYSSPAAQSSPQPSMQSAPQQAPTASAPAGGAKGAGIATALDRILNGAKGGANSNQIGQMLDALRTSISKSDPLNPILFELSMEAGKLKSLGDKPVDGSNLQNLDAKIQKWKSKV